MRTSKELKIERAAKLEAQSKITATIKTEKRSDFNDDEKKAFDALQDEIVKLDDSIKRALTVEMNEARAAGDAGQVINKGEKAELNKMAKRFSILRALRKGADNSALDGVEAEINEIAKDEARIAGIDLGKQTITVPGSLIRSNEDAEKRAAGQTVTLDSGGYGGALVGTDVQIIEGLYPKMTVNDLKPTILNNLQGDIILPTVAQYAFSWLAEDAAATAQKSAITGPTLSPKRAAALVPLSHRLLKQTAGSVEGMVNNMLGNAYGFALMQAIVNGGGTTDPMGILNASGVQAAADISAVAPTWAKVVELEGLVKTANADGMGYLMHPKTEAKLKTVSKDTGSGRFLIEDGKLNGYPYAVSTAVPALNTGTTYPLIFGNFAELFIGTWGGVSFLADPYTGASSNNLNIHVNAHADANIPNGAAFAVNTWLTF